MHCYGMLLKCSFSLQTCDTLDNVLMNYKTLPALPANAPPGMILRQARSLLQVQD